MTNKSIKENKKNKNNKKKIIISIIVLLVIILFLSITLLTVIKKKEVFRIPNKIEKEKLYKLQGSFAKAPEKIAGDKKGPEIEVVMENKLIDYKTKKFPEIIVRAKDESGVYKIVYYVMFRNKEIGFIQDSTSKKRKMLTSRKILNEKVILDGLKTFIDYEGAELEIIIKVTDNGGNESQKIVKGIKVVDNTAPEKAEIIWTYYPRTIKPGVVIYNRDRKNTFIIKQSKDLPAIEGNVIKEYEYGIKDREKKIIYNKKISRFDEIATDAKVELEKDGKYYFYVKSYDLSGNFSENEFLFGVDKIPPFVKIDISNGQKFETSEIVNVTIQATDNESGLDKVRIGSSKEELIMTPYIKFTQNISYQLPDKEGLYDIWCEVKDVAGNSSDYAKFSIYVYRNNNIKIRSTSKEMESKEKIIRVDQNNNMGIQSSEEK